MDGYALFDVIRRVWPRVGRAAVVVLAGGLLAHAGWAGKVVDGYVRHVVRVAEQRVQPHVDRLVEQLRPVPAVTPSPSRPLGGHRAA